MELDDVAVRGADDMFMVITLVRLWERAHNKAQGGTLEATSWEGIHKKIVVVFSAPGTRRVWKVVQYMFAPEFVSFVEGSVRRERAQRERDAAV